MTSKHVATSRRVILAAMMLLLSLSLNAQNMRFNFEDITLGQALSEIENKTNYKFVYSSALTEANELVSLQYDGSSIDALLDKLLDGKNVQYRRKDDTVVLTPGDIAPVEYITGTVTDSKGEPVPGATVLFSGTSNGTYTDANGNYSIPVDKNSTTLEFSSIGYDSVIEAVNGRARINVVLSDSVEYLDELIVVGFGTQKKVNLTGSVAVANAEDIQSRPVSDLPTAIEGLMPGLQVTKNSGDIASTMSINVRGQGTIGQGSSSSPLILIDGMQGDINLINPEDVESISVLKDAASASIYGSRAAFGVILITTKHGREQKTKISYNNNFRFADAIRTPEPMDSYTFSVFMNEAHFNANLGAHFSEETQKNMIEYLKTGFTTEDGTVVFNRGGIPASGNQWGKPKYDPYNFAYASVDIYEEMYEQSFSNEHNLSVSGGSDKVNYYASFGYMNQDGILKPHKDGVERYSANVRLHAQVTKWAAFEYTTRFIRTDMIQPSNGGQDVYYTIGRSSWPNLPVYDENGFYTDDGAYPGHPVIITALGGDINTTTNSVTQQAALILEPIKNWVTHVEFNYNNQLRHERRVNKNFGNHYVDGTPEPNRSRRSSIRVRDNHTNLWNLNVYSSYFREFGNGHELTVMAGFQAEEARLENSSVLKYGLQLEDQPELDLTTGIDESGRVRDPEISGGRSSWATAGFFGRVNYNYKDRYLLEGNIRYDGTSRFRADSRWVLSPSISAGWNIANEGFFENAKSVVNTLKLRASYGVLGNQTTNSYYPTYRIINLYNQNGNHLQNHKKPNTAQVGNLISSDLTWETVRTANVALDWGMFNNRFQGSFEVFRRETLNMVGPALQMPEVLGPNPPVSNNCDLRTDGWELNFSWRDRTSYGLGYGISANISDAISTILSYPGNITHSINTYMEGKRVGDIWGFTTVGIAQSDEEMQAHLAKNDQSSIGSQWGEGDIMYKDMNGDGKVDRGESTWESHGDLSVIGNSTPRYHFGITLNADFKGFDLRVFLQGVARHDLWTDSAQYWGCPGYVWNVCGYGEHNDYYRANPAGIAGHEIPVNKDAWYPRPVVNSTKNQQCQTRYLLDASYMRIKNLQVGYSLPRTLIQKCGLSNARVYFSVDNLATFTKLSTTMDPETISGGHGGSMRGNAYPLTCTKSFGLSVTF